MKKTKKTLLLIFSSAFAALALPVLADTTNVKTQSIVHVNKRGAHCADDPNCMNRYHQPGGAGGNASGPRG
jgi:hypothetical protein